MLIKVTQIREHPQFMTDNVLVDYQVIWPDGTYDTKSEYLRRDGTSIEFKVDIPGEYHKTVEAINSCPCGGCQ